MNSLRKYPTIACCGIDCALCPRHHTEGRSRCGGCGGAGFQGNPSCVVLRCCTAKGLEVCGECAEYPCPALSRTVRADCDSFVTHKKTAANSDAIKANGLGPFLARQQTRQVILQDLLAHHDDGRAKSFFCLGCALMPIRELQETAAMARSILPTTSLKARCAIVRRQLQKRAAALNIALTLTKDRSRPPGQS